MQFLTQRSLRQSGPMILIALLSLLVSSCITVNVNFPEAAVQQAADSYVEQLYRLREESRRQELEKNQGGTERGSSIQSTEPSFLQALSHFILPVAHASAEFKVMSPEIREIQLREVSRLDRVDDFKKQGFIGENNRGLLEIRGELMPLQRRAIEKLVNEENADRELLFAEVLKLNGMGSPQLPLVRGKFMSSFQSKSRPGTWIQDSNGNWSRK